MVLTGDLHASILIVTRNNEKTLGRVVEACLSQQLSAGEFETVLIDDASDSPQLSLLREIESLHHDKIASGVLRIIRCGPHRGVGPCRNISVREAKGGFLAAIDGDAFPEPGWLESVLLPFDDSSVGIVSSRVLFDSDSSLVNGQGCTLSRYGFGLDRYLFQPVENLPDNQEEVLYAMGCGMAFRREAWESVNGFDEDIVYGYEDADFALRVWARGLRVITQPSAVVLHRTLSFGPLSRERLFFATRNRWFFLIRHWPFGWLLCAAVCQAGALILTRRGRVDVPLFLRAVFSLIPRLPGLLKSRSLRPAGNLLRRLVFHRYISGGLYGDLQILHNAPLTPAGRINWSDGDTFRLGGGRVSPDYSSVSLINNGWCDISVFSTTEELTVSAEVINGGSAAVSFSFLDINDGCLEAESRGIAGKNLISIKVPQGAARCRVSIYSSGYSSDPVSPLAAVRLLEVSQR